MADRSAIATAIPVRQMRPHQGLFARLLEVREAWHSAQLIVSRGREGKPTQSKTMDQETAPLLTDEQVAAIHPSQLALVQALEDAGKRTPSGEVAQIANALATFFRTPD